MQVGWALGVARHEAGRDRLRGSKGPQWVLSSRSAASAWRRRSTASCSRRRVSSVVVRASDPLFAGGRLMGRIVLVTGVSGDLGGRFARLLSADPAVDRVIGVDVVPPRGDMGDVRFVRADIRNPVIAKVIAGEDVDTVVHMSVIATPGTAGGRTSMKELNVIGTMQLLAACQKAPNLKRLVVRSSTAVYGSSPRDPAMFTEDMAPKRIPKSGFAKDVVEVEGYVRGFARRRPDIEVTTLRAANTVGATVSSPMTQYFRLPVVPTILGYDARLQFLHEDDLLRALNHATLEGVHGTFNIAGDGIVMLSQALRRLGKPSIPMPA